MTVFNCLVVTVFIASDADCSVTDVTRVWYVLFLAKVGIRNIADNQIDCGVAV